jgi:carboxyl-terminal processing protease
MPAQRRLGAASMRLLPSAVLVIASLLAGGWLVQRAVNGADHSARDGAVLLDQVMVRVRENYVEEVPEGDLWELAARGMLDELGDPHSAYLSPERLERLNRVASNSYRGVGMSVDVREGWIVVTQPRAGSPAERAGIQVGDRLVEVEGRSMAGWTVTEAREALQGPLGTSVGLVIERNGARHRVTLERADIRRSAVARATLLDGGVAYLAVTTFSDSTEAEVEATVDSLRRLGATSLVLDLRGNPGGLLAQGVAVADLFLAPGQRIVSTEGRVDQANAVHVDGTPERWPTMPVAVLVNGGTASAAEIVAGALQDHDRALVMGRVTYGKGSAQAIYPLENGAAVQLTNARWFTPLGRSIEVAAAGEEPLADADTARPVFRTSSGRAIHGGGGIVPDLVAGDSAPPPAQRRLYAELAGDFEAWREVLVAQASTLVRSGAVRDSLFTVQPAWRAQLRRAVARAGLKLSAATFDEAAAIVDQELGREVARQAFGVPYQQRRQVRNDPVVQRAAAVLRRAREPRQVFATE